MVFTQINCPNCSAPIEVDSQSKSARCSYCQTIFIPRPEIAAKNRSTIAAERAAAELTLRRLLREQRDTQRQLSEAVYFSQAPYYEALEKQNHELKLFEIARSEKEKVFKNGGYVFIKLALLPIGLALITGWTWPWYIVVFLLFFEALSKFILNGIQKSKPPKFPPLPTIVRSEAEILFTNRLAEIDEEIASHRSFLDKSKPIYR